MHYYHEVLALAVQEQRVLFTNDAKDFGELVFHQHLPILASFSFL